LGYRRSRSYHEGYDGRHSNNTSAFIHSQQSSRRRSRSSSRAAVTSLQPSSTTSKSKTIRRSTSIEKHSAHNQNASPLAYDRGHPLAPIPGSPYATDASPPPSPTMKRDGSRPSQSSSSHEKRQTSSPTNHQVQKVIASDELGRSRSSRSFKSNIELVPYRAPQPQSLTAALEKIALSSPQTSDKCSQQVIGGSKSGKHVVRDEHSNRLSSSFGQTSDQNFCLRFIIDLSSTDRRMRDTIAPNSPLRDSEELTENRYTRQSGPSSVKPLSFSSTPVLSTNKVLLGREISAPIFDAVATDNMSPVKLNSAGKPIPIPPDNVKLSMSGPQLQSGNGLFDPNPNVYYPKQRTSSLDTG
jgi:Rho GTPase-activating protein 39